MTTTQTAGTIIGHALTALGQHIIDHQLPAPSTITTETAPLEVVVCVSGHHRAWIETVHVDTQHNEYRTPSDGLLEPYLVTRWQVRLPDTGIRITLRAVRDLPVKAVGA